MFVDYENVQVQSLAMLKDDHFKVRIFLGANNTKLPVALFMSMQELGPRVELIALEASGKNALDFHIAFYVGVEAARDPTGFFHIISKDSGFDPLIHHLKAKRIFSSRSASIEDMPCFQTAATQAPHSETKAPSKAFTEQLALHELVEKAISLVIDGKASRPTTRKTLLSTLQAKLGKEVESKRIEYVLTVLIAKGHVKADGAKVSYPARQKSP